jgi:hypothetical protein
MSSRAEVRVAIRATSNIQRVLRGALTDVRSFDRSVESSARTGAGAMAREWTQAGGVVRRIMHSTASEATRSEDARRRAATASHSVIERGLRSELRLAREIHREERRRPPRRGGRGEGGGGGGGGIGGAIVSGATAAATDALGRARGFASAGGARSPEELAAASAAFRLSSIRLSGNAGLDAGARERMEASVLATSERTGIGADELLAGLEGSFNRFNNLETVVANIDRLANVALATGSSFENIVGAVGAAERQFNLTTAETATFADMMVQAGAEGSIDADALAGAFGSTLGSVRRGTGVGGLEGARQALGIAEVLGAGEFNAAEAATHAERLVRSLNRDDVRANLAEVGVNVTDSSGAMRPIADITRDMSRVNERALTGAFGPGDMLAGESAGVLSQVFRDNPEAFARAFNVTGEHGSEIVSNNVRDLTASEAHRFTSIGARQFSEYMRGDPEAMWSGAADTGGALAEWEAAHPILSQLASMAGTGLGGAGGFLGMRAAMTGSLPGLGQVGTALSAAAAPLGLAAAGLVPVAGASALSDIGNSRASLTGAAVTGMDVFSAPELGAFGEAVTQFRAALDRFTGNDRPAGGRGAAADAKVIGDAVRDGVRAGMALGPPPASARSPGEPGRRG